MLGKCGDIGLRSLEVQVQLLDALVAPVLGYTYCAEVWWAVSALARQYAACLHGQ
jgi:hypothetical protein